MTSQRTELIKILLNDSHRRLGIIAIIAFLLVAIAFIVVHKNVTKPAQDNISSNTNSLYLAAVQPEQLPVATVNNHEITAEEFNKLYLARAGDFSSKITIKEVEKALKLKRQIAGQLIVAALVEQAAAEHNLTVDKKEIDASIDRLKKTFPNPEKYAVYTAQLPDGENYLRNVARTNILKQKLVDAVGIKLDEKAAKAAKTKNKGDGTEQFIRNALLIQQLKTQAEIANLLEQRHVVMLHQTKLVGFSRAKIKVISK